MTGERVRRESGAASLNPDTIRAFKPMMGGVLVLGESKQRISD